MNRAEIQSLINSRIANGEDCTLPPGVHDICANAPGEGLSINVPDGKSWKLDLGGSTLRREASATMANYGSIIRWRNNAGIKLRIVNGTLDGNRDGIPAPAAPYDYQHSASVRAEGSLGTGQAALVAFDGLLLKGRPNSDHLWFNERVKDIRITNVFAEEQASGIREDIQFSYRPSGSLILADTQVDSVRSEAPDDVDGGFMKFDTVLARKMFNWQGDSKDFMASQLVSPGYNFFFRVGGRVVNSHIANIYRVMQCRVAFENSRFIVFADPTDATKAKPILIMHDYPSADHFAHFIGCRFSPVPGVVNGCYIQNFSQNATETKPVLWVKDCTNDVELDYFLKAQRLATVTVEGGRLSGRSAVTWLGCTANYAMLGSVRDTRRWKGVPVELYGGGLPPTDFRMRFDGDHDGEAAQPVSGSNDPTIKCESTRTILVDSDPNGRLRGVPGDRGRLRDGSAWWRYTGATANLMTWAPIV